MTSPRLHVGARVTRREPGWLQVGWHADARLAVPDREPVRRLLDCLARGDGLPDDHEAAIWLDRLAARGLIAVDAERREDAEDPVRRVADPLSLARIHCTGDAGLEATTALRAAGLRTTEHPHRATARLHVCLGAEPERGLLDDDLRADRPHLLVTYVAGRSRVGPLVVPGLTACLRCIDLHAGDRDPHHARVLAQHHARIPADRPTRGLLALCLATAAHELVRWVSGAEPQVWSATLEPATGQRVAWPRHPSCGCAWAAFTPRLGAAG